MRNILIASHGPLAGAMAETCKFIMGNQENLYSFNAYMDDTDPQPKMKELVEELSKDSELIILTDIFGGSVNNYMMQFIDENIYLFAGVNLPLLLSLCIGKDRPLQDVVEQVKSENKTNIICCNDLCFEEVHAEDF